MNSLVITLGRGHSDRGRTKDSWGDRLLYTPWDSSTNRPWSGK
jgi:hypothetical protein